MALTTAETALLREYICSRQPTLLKMKPARLAQIADMSDTEVRALLDTFKASKVSTLDAKITSLTAEKTLYE